MLQPTSAFSNPFTLYEAADGCEYSHLSPSSSLLSSVGARNDNSLRLIVSVASSGLPMDNTQPIFSPTSLDSKPDLNIANASSRLPFNMETAYTNDLDQQEELARTFQPELQGSLVGEKKSSHVLTEEYARADPIYVTKTAALPLKYSHYRSILGDGNCGWRAIGFSYFETLLQLQNKPQLEEELARITSLNNFLTTVGGYASWVFDDMAEETLSLLRDIAVSIDTPQRMTEMALLQRFNDAETSNSIVYHLRLLASSWLKGNAAVYEDFIPDNNGVEGYVKEWIEPPNQEIDHLGMTLLVDVLLKPVGVAVEIVYLDRSEGSQVNTHLIQPEDAIGNPSNPSAPVIHLLYRPSHYDILYKDVATVPTIPRGLMEGIHNSQVQVNRATTFNQQHTIQSTSMHDFSSADMSSILGIPGFQCAPLPHQDFFQPLFDSQYTSPLPTSCSPVSAEDLSRTTASLDDLSLPANFTSHQLTSSTPPGMPRANNGRPQSSHDPYGSAMPIQGLQNVLQVVTQQSISPRPTLSSHSSLSPRLSNVPTPSSVPTSSNLPTPLIAANSPFRPSRWEWDARAAEQESPVVFQTNTFKNSHYNTAHYNNPNFQPEEWTPDSEDTVSGQSPGLIKNR